MEIGRLIYRMKKWPMPNQFATGCCCSCCIACSCCAVIQEGQVKTELVNEASKAGCKNPL